jgi:hypothetical protein
VTARARQLLKAVQRRDGRQAVILSWPVGAAYLPRPLYAPTSYDTVIDEVEGCPVYVDRRRLAVHPDRSVVLDVEPRSDRRTRPALRVREGSGEGPPSQHDSGVAEWAARSGAVEQRALVELRALYGNRVDAEVLRAKVSAALHDLRGSVAAEALPEMVARLVGHRLEASGMALRLSPSGHR